MYTVAYRISAAAHPHSRGENRLVVWENVQGAGSSPLTRGKHLCRTLREQRDGLIPTHAGKTACPGRWQARLAAHPHSRGENDLTDPIMLVMPGSSPLTRGKLTLDDPGHVMRGLIPTHAGKTAPVTDRRPRWGAHPHSRGENLAATGLAAAGAGSSPLTRGKRR